MNQTIVACVLKKLEEAVPETVLEQVQTLVPGAEVSALIDRGEGYTMVSLGDAAICVLLDNTGREEALEVKITLTGLCPHSDLSYQSASGMQIPNGWIANLAGIAEFRCEIAPRELAVILCSKDNTMFTR